MLGLGEPRPVRDVYAGEHWVEFLRVVDCPPPGAEVRGWVASAGWGLIPLEAEIAGYSATFSGGAPDSIGGLGVSNGDWWESLAEWGGPCPGSSRSVERLVRGSQPGDLVVVAASPPYLGAMVSDLAAACQAAKAGAGADILVMGAGVPQDLKETFPGHVSTFNSGLQRLVGGSLIGLNIRVLGEALKKAGPSRTRMQAWVQKSGAKYPAGPGPLRVRADDLHVARFISDRLDEDPAAKASPLLREWRGRGMACEQGRFRDIYDGVIRSSPPLGDLRAGEKSP